MKKFFVLLMALVCLCNFSHAQERPSYIAIEANSGKLLFSSNAEQRRSIASLSQVATAMVTLDWLARTKMPMDSPVTVPNEARGIRSGNPMGLQPGDKLTLRDALYSTLLGSDNASALTLAHFVGRDLVTRHGGGTPIAQFVREMNNMAKELGMIRTRFVSPHGLDAGANVNSSCAVDMALLGMYSMQNSAFCYIVSQASRRIAVQSPLRGEGLFDITNYNRMMTVPGVDGIKAGSSQAAGPCIMLSVTRHAVSRFSRQLGTNAIYAQRMIIVVLGSADRYTLARQMMNEGWRVWDNWQSTGEERKDPKEFLQLKPLKKSAKKN